MRFSLKHIYALLFAIFSIWVFNFCKNDPDIPDTHPYKNLVGDVEYVGMATCRSCHNNVYETFIHTGMGRSFHHASRQKSDAEFGSHAVVYDSLNDFFYYPF